MVALLILAGIACAAVGFMVWFFLALRKEDVQQIAVPVDDPKSLSSSSSVKKPADFSTPSAQDRVENPVFEGSFHAQEAASGKEEKQLVISERVSLDVMAQENAMRQLREEMTLLREKAVIQARNALEVINKLRDENGRLSATLEKERSLEDKRRTDEEEVLHIRAENAAFKLQLEGLRQTQGEPLSLANEKIARLESENAQLRLSAQEALAEQQRVVDQMKENHQIQVAALDSQIAELHRDNEKVRVSQALPLDKDAAHSSLGVGTLEGLQAELAGVRKDREISEKRVTELEQINADLQGNNQFLQYELAKSRAQVAGLDAVSSGAHQRFEDASRAVHGLSKDNLALKNQADALEGSIVELRKISGELTRRERIVQLEKERATF